MTFYAINIFSGQTFRKNISIYTSELTEFTSANLDIKNLNGLEDLLHKSPEVLVADIWDKEQRILEILSDIKTSLSEEKVSNG